MKIATKDLTGKGLAFAVALAEGWEPTVLIVMDIPVLSCRLRQFTDLSWAACGPIIERERINIGESIHPTMDWTATLYVADEEPWQFDGPTPLIAAMRCFVASALGDDVDVPEELLK